MSEKYEQAEQRVNDSDKLSGHHDFILADWPEGEEHWDWVASASEEEILDWAETCQPLRAQLLADTARAHSATRVEARANARVAKARALNRQR